MVCRKMDYFMWLVSMCATVRELNAVATLSRVEVRPVASRIGLIVEKAESAYR